MHIYISWCWCINAELRKVTWCDNYGFLTSLYPLFYPMLITVSWPTTGILNDPSESKVPVNMGLWPLAKHVIPWLGARGFFVGKPLTVGGD